MGDSFHLERYGKGKTDDQSQKKKIWREHRIPEVQYVSRDRARKDQKEMRDLNVTEVEHLIDEWIFSERDRSILKRRLLDGIHYEPLAQEFDMSVRQIKNIVYKGEKKIFSKVA